MTRYAVHPMEANFQEWNSAYKEKRTRYWARLRKAFFDYQEVNENANFNDFNSFMKTHYGMKVNMVGDSIGTTYEVIDESKYTLFLLKYGQT